jgi:hypothetical protein
MWLHGLFLDRAHRVIFAITAPPKKEASQAIAHIQTAGSLLNVLRSLTDSLTPSAG